MTTIPDLLILDGHGFSWKRLVLLRKQQVDACRAARDSQTTLFALREDHRSAGERTASDRYAQPSLLDVARS
jgi:hypothetical protein